MKTQEVQTALDLLSSVTYHDADEHPTYSVITHSRGLNWKVQVTSGEDVTVAIVAMKVVNAIILFDRVVKIFTDEDTAKAPEYTDSTMRVGRNILPVRTYRNGDVYRNRKVNGEGPWVKVN